LLFLLIFEGVALELLPNNLLNLSVIITPHWILVFLITLSFLYEEADPQEFIPYAIIFGLLVDIVYTDTLGVYMFDYGLALFTANNITIDYYNDIIYMNYFFDFS